MRNYELDDGAFVPSNCINLSIRLNCKRTVCGPAREVRGQGGRNLKLNSN